MNNIRKPVVAGQFYEGNQSDLNQSIKNCFLEDRGPKTLPEIKNGNKKIKAVVVPHAGYIYSGAIAAHSYNLISKNGFADTFIILGPNHTGMGSGVSVLTEGLWETPLGSVQINSNIAKQIHKGIIYSDDDSHLYEHSIEVQLPFLQYSANDKKFDFVPICMSMQDKDTSVEVGTIIADSIKDSNSKVVIVASSDFSHAGFNYMSMPPEGLRVDKYAEQQDRLAIKDIISLNAEGLIDTVHQNNITMCGYGPVAATITAAKILGATHAELLKYGTSYEVHPSSSCVGYGAIAIY